jgi:hypothetical protein
MSSDWRIAFQLCIWSSAAMVMQTLRRRAAIPTAIARALGLLPAQLNDQVGETVDHVGVCEEPGSALTVP